ncbi:MAG: hypothetical protein ACXWQQ_02385 [Pseudobdellovibrio sp.]
MSGLSNVDFESEQKVALTPADIKNQNSATESTMNSSASRGPASVENLNSAVLEQNFFCNHSLNELKNRVDSSLVMINFKLCKEIKNIESISLVNHSNGFRAHIFKNSNSNYKTDYIQLNSGVNNLVIEVVLKDGQKNTDSLVILTGS